MRIHRVQRSIVEDPKAITKFKAILSIKTHSFGSNYENKEYKNETINKCQDILLLV